jgi:hypothetical protein
MSRIRRNGYTEDLHLPVHGPKFVYVDENGRVHLSKVDKQVANQPAVIASKER